MDVVATHWLPTKAAIHPKLGTPRQLAAIARGLDGERLRYQDLIKDNGGDSTIRQTARFHRKISKLPLALGLYSRDNLD